MNDEGLKRARYSEVERRLWNDARFRSLSPIPPCGQGLWLYLLTTPSLGSLPGLIVMGESAMAEHLEWPLEDFRKAFREAFAKGMVEADWKSRLVVTLKAIGRQTPQSPNVIVSWRQQWFEVPECDLKTKYYRRLKAYVEGLPEGFQKAFAKAVADPSPNQEQEQEQEQEEEEEFALTEAPSRESGTRPVQPRLIPVTVELTPTERTVHTAIVGDESLRPIVRDPAKLARDLLVVAPGIDLPAMVRRAGAWLRANPTKRKSNGAKFLLLWATKQQDERGGFGQASARPASTRVESDFDRKNRVERERRERERAEGSA